MAQTIKCKCTNLAKTKDATVTSEKVARNKEFSNGRSAKFATRVLFCFLELTL